MELNETFVPLALEDLVDTAREYKEQGYQLAQMMGVLKEDDTVWLYYTFIKGNEVINRRIEGIIKGETEVPSLTPLYIAIFVNENEAHDLFGVNIVGNLIDFEGAFYRFAEGVEAPMSIVSPEQLAAREKAAKIAKAKAAKAAKAAKEKAAKEAEAAAPADAATGAACGGLTACVIFLIARLMTSHLIPTLVPFYDSVIQMRFCSGHIGIGIDQLKAPFVLANAPHARCERLTWYDRGSDARLEARHAFRLAREPG